MRRLQKTQEERQKKNIGSDATQNMTRRMICGGLAGCIAKTATNPLERIKMLSQTGEHGLQQTSVSSLYRNILKNEGFIGLWAGNGVNRKSAAFFLALVSVDAKLTGRRLQVDVYEQNLFYSPPLDLTSNSVLF